MSLVFKKIVAAVDVNDSLAEIVLMTARDLAEASGGELHVFDAVPFINTIDSPYEIGSLQLEQLAHQQEDEQRRSSTAALVKRIAPNAIARVEEGDASQGVTDHARKVDADLIVVGSHQKNWWLSLIQGSESRDVIREAPCAVFVVTSAHKKRIAAQT